MYIVTDLRSCSGTFATLSEAVEHLGRVQEIWPTSEWHLITAEN
jgi:hypothetical protein